MCSPSGVDVTPVGATSNTRMKINPVPRARADACLRRQNFFLFLSYMQESLQPAFSQADEGHKGYLTPDELVTFMTLVIKFANELATARATLKGYVASVSDHVTEEKVNLVQRYSAFFASIAGHSSESKRLSIPREVLALWHFSVNHLTHVTAILERSTKNQTKLTVQHLFDCLTELNDGISPTPSEVKWVSTQAGIFADGRSILMRDELLRRLEVAIALWFSPSTSLVISRRPIHHEFPRLKHDGVVGPHRR